ncbi:DUF3800 domain-containing protein [Chloroflexota bacterium]
MYIDETGDHRYKQLDKLESRYLGLTGVLFKKEYYNGAIPQALESFKKQFLKYDPDTPPVLVRSWIVNRKHAFGVLVNENLRKNWEYAILNLYRTIKMQIFTVVMDKKAHIERYPMETFDAYVYSLAVLLWRVRGYLSFHRLQAEIVAEARGKVEDANIQRAFKYIRQNGFTEYGTAEGYCQAFPDDEIKFRTKIHNVAGLQLADLIAYGQKVRTILDKGKPYHKPPSQFTNRLNEAIEPNVNRYGRYYLE